MKKLFCFLCIFFTLIFISSFSWAQTDTFYVNTSVVNSPVGNIDISSLYDTYFSYNNIPISNMTNCVVVYDLSYNSTLISLSEGNFYYMDSTIYCTNYIFQLEFDGTSIIGGSNPPYININDTYNVVGNAIYTDNTLTNFYSSSNVNGNNTSFFENAFNYDSEGGSGEGGEGGGDSGDDSGFLSSLADMLIHIVVPTSEQWEDLQDSFETNVLNKFNITSMSFNDDLIYNKPVIGSQDNITPNFSLGEYGTLNFDYFITLLDTPISFGSLRYLYGDSILSYHIPTEGVTIRDVLNFLLIINIFIVNIVLYNKFLNKGGV